MNLAEYRRSHYTSCRLPALGRAGRRRRRPQQGRLVPAHRALSRTRSRFRRSGRTRRDRRRASTTRLRRLGSGWAIFVEAQRHPAQRLSAERVSRCRLGPGRCRAPRAVRGRGRALRVSLFPDLPVSAAGRGCRARRTPGSMRDRSAGRLPTRTRCCAALSIAPIACCTGRRVSCRSADGSMTARP